ncbi:MAG: phosphate acetyltransferase [Christensenellales bacterium]|jgi:phosphate acetyltransferase
MGLMDEIKNKARANLKRIVLPEGTEERTVQAAAIIAKERLATVILIGSPDEVKKQSPDIESLGVTILDPATSDKLNDYADTFYQLRKHKGVTPETALKTVLDPLYYACMMIKKGDADGMVAGAINTTTNTLRPALQIIKTAPGISVVSSCFVMILKNADFGHNGVMVFGDCAVNPNPNAEELAAIAVSTAKTAAQLTGMEPKVAMLSFSTKGSAKHELVDKVRQATELVKQMKPDLMVDGELQADAALVASVGQLKSPGSPVAGHANVLIFPDLQAGNIGYKLVQRLAGAEAIGPVCQGLAAPVNDLSRGCSVDDIVSVVAITAVQAQG